MSQARPCTGRAETRRGNFVRPTQFQYMSRGTKRFGRASLIALCFAIGFRRLLISSIPETEARTTT